MKSGDQDTFVSQSEHKKAQRRALLGAISTAGVVGATKLPGQWMRPVVDHVLLPAHAATTDDAGAAGSYTSNCVVTCTSAHRLELIQTTVASGSLYITVSQFQPYTQCSDSFGGFTTSAGSLGSTFSCLVWLGCTTELSGSTSFYCGAGTSFTSDAICNVTAV